MTTVFKRVFAVVIIFTIGMTIRYFYVINNKEELPIIQPADILADGIVSDSLKNIKAGHVIRSFHLVNQNGDTITEKVFENKIYVANFFFATCKTICPNMNGNLKRVYDEYVGDPKVGFISHSSMPSVDTPRVLKIYAERFNAQLPQWQFVTGNKKEIYDLARNFYLAVKNKGTGDSADFIHTENLVLIDTHKRIRGYYDGTATSDVDRLIEDISILKEENVR